MQKLLKNCTVIDGHGGVPLENAHVLISGDRIERVGTGPLENDANGTDVIDLQGGFLLPGFCSTHVHLGDLWPHPEPADEPVVERAIRAGRNAMDALRCGITSMRSLGEHEFIDVAWRRAFEQGTFLGPTIIASGNALMAPGGHANFTQRNIGVTGPDALRREIQRLLDHDVDCIKLITTTGETLDEGESFGQLQFTTDELHTAVDMAHEAGKPIFTHTGTPEGVRQVVEVGVDGIEHGYVMDQEAVDMLAENDIYLTPTLSLTHSEEYYERLRMPESQRDRFRRVRDRHFDSFRRALEAGVKITCGADINPVGFCTLSEIEMMVKLGMSESEAIVAATSMSAGANGLAEDQGVVEAGKKADLVVLGDNPLEDISNVWNTRLVVKSGRLVDTRPSESQTNFLDVLLSFREQE